MIAARNMTSNEQVPASSGILPKLAALALVVAALGLPVNNLYAYGLLAAATLIVFTALLTRSARRWLAAFALALAVLAQHLLLPAPRIEEGHNAFLIDQPGSALEQGLPSGAFGPMAERFNAAYPAERRCQAGAFLCWRPGGVPDRAFAFAADGFFDGHAYSRRVTDIDFHSAVWLRLGFINDLSLNFVGREGEPERLRRDRRSLAIFGRWQLTLPWFVMYRFPADFAGSDLCWRGEVLWERPAERFERLEHKDWRCRAIQSEDIGRRIFGVSIGPRADLAMSLDANWSVKARRALDAATMAIGVIGILMLLTRWQPRRAVLPLLLVAGALVLVVLIDVTFIGGFRPFDGGDDGLVFSGFARQMLQALAAGNIAETLRGAENVFFFTPGMRYVRTIEYLIFGDTYLGYLSVILVAPLVIHAVSARFLGSWALVFTLGFVLTPLGVLFGTSYLHYVIWAARGFADPLAATAFLSGLVLIAGPGPGFDTRAARAFFGALLIAIAVIVRPNLAPGAGVLLGGVGLAALSGHHFARLAALCLGFAPILTTLWHNWHFGGSLVPISDNMTAANIYMMRPAAYLSALGELIRLDFAGENLNKAAGQIRLWLSGPSGWWFLIPLHVAAMALLVRVVCSPRFEPMLRLVALATIALSLLGLIYLVSVRYHLVMWFQMALVVTAWIRQEGVGLIDRYAPGWRERQARRPAFARAHAALTRLGAFVGANGSAANP